MSENFNRILKEDLENILAHPLPWNGLDGKSILITGATGMLASYITHLLLYMNKEKGTHINVIALCRNEEKARSAFGYDDSLTILCQDVCTPIHTDMDIDYIFHFAGNASPYHILNDPTGICSSNMTGTFNIAELAREKHCRKIIFASTREVYGRNDEAAMLTESSFGVLDCMEDRACYPESKRAAETILHSYFIQYGVCSNALRIAHAYGPGMRLGNDGRVMSDFINDAVNDKDIIIRSSGEAVRAFCYITDAITAIMTVTFNGEDGQAYNIADESQPMMIKDIASIISRHHGGIQVSFEPQSDNRGYCNYRRTGLDTSKITALGWAPEMKLEEGIRRTLESFGK